MEVRGRIHSLESFGTLDGPGIRFVVFLQGCRLRCKYCHNPDTWEVAGGTEMSVAEVMGRIEPCRNFLRTGGVTLSGGEPLLQSEFAAALLLACRGSGFHTALDTAGSQPLEESRTAIDAADLLLLDIKALDSDVCRELTGWGNHCTLATLDYCEAVGKPVWIRHVLVPGVTLEMDRLRALAGYLARFRCVKRVELLPFHRLAAFKWTALGAADPLDGVPEPTPEQCREAERMFAAM